MRFNARARNIRVSPFKLRPIADVVRGKDVNYALAWLNTLPLKRAKPMVKVIASAVANAKSRQNINADALIIKEIRVDQGPMYRYFKPGAMGRANIYRKRFSHVNVIVESMV